MNEEVKSIEFESRLGSDGRLLVPEEIQTELQRLEGRRIRVRIIPERDARKLRTRNITEDEIDRIATLQREERRNVVRFLLSEGTLVRDRKGSGLKGRRS
jgi:hypothetical protein